MIGYLFHKYPGSLTDFAVIMVLFSIVGFTVFIWLILRSGHDYSVHDTETHAVDYANVIKEGHGGLTAFLWVSFILLFGWTVMYFATQWDQFARLFAGFK
jgi:hypothetical protein